MVHALESYKQETEPCHKTQFAHLQIGPNQRTSPTGIIMKITYHLIA